MSALVYCPFPDSATAERIAGQLLDERIAACANIGGAIRSLFAWQGARDSADEVAVLFKTDARLLDRLVARLEALHPYDAPAILGWRCEAAGAATQAWLGALAEGQDETEQSP